MLEVMSEDVWQEWQAYGLMEPLDARREFWGAANIVAELRYLFELEFSGGKPVERPSVESFIPHWQPVVRDVTPVPVSRAADSEEAILALFSTFVERSGGADLRGAVVNAPP